MFTDGMVYKSHSHASFERFHQLDTVDTLILVEKQEALLNGLVKFLLEQVTSSETLIVCLSFHYKIMYSVSHSLTLVLRFNKNFILKLLRRSVGLVSGINAD